MVTKTVKKKATAKTTKSRSGRKAFEKSLTEKSRAELRKLAGLSADGRAVSEGGKLPAMLSIHKLQRTWLGVELIGTTSLISNEMPLRSIVQIVMRQMGFKVPVYPRNPYQDCMDAAHICRGVRDWDWRHDNLYGFPAIGIKKSFVAGAVRSDQESSKGKGGSKSGLISHLYVHGPWIELGGGKALVPFTGHADMEMSMEPVTLYGASGRRTTSIAFRPLFHEWSMYVYVSYPAALIQPKDVLSMIEIAGQIIGIGSWRNERGGDHGLFMLGENIDQYDEDFVPPSFTHNEGWKEPKRRATVVGQRHIHQMISGMLEQVETELREGASLGVDIKPLKSGKKKAATTKSSTKTTESSK